MDEWTNPRAFSFEARFVKEGEWFKANRIWWKPWRWEVRTFVPGEGYSKVVKRNLTKVSARGFVKLLSEM